MWTPVSLDLPGDEPVLPVLAPTAHELVAVASRLQHHADIVRVVLEITIHGHHVAAARDFESRRHGGRLPGVVSQPDQHDVAARCRQRHEFLPGTIGAAVVDIHDFPRDAELRTRRFHAAVKVLDALLLVVEGNYDRKFHGPIQSPGTLTISARDPGSQRRNRSGTDRHETPEPGPRLASIDASDEFPWTGRLPRVRRTRRCHVHLVAVDRVIETFLELPPCQRRMGVQPVLQIGREPRPLRRHDDPESPPPVT